MTRNVGERWEEYLRLGRRMSPHTVAAYLGDFHSLMEFLSAPMRPLISYERR